MAAPAAISAPLPEAVTGVGHYKRGDYKSALQSFMTARLKGDRTPETYLYVAHCWSALGKPDTAAKIYRDIIKTCKGQPAERLAAQCIKGLEAKSSPLSGKHFVISSPAGAGPANTLISMPAEERIPYKRQAGNHLYVRGEINGRSTDVLFDTGAYTVLVGKDQLVSLGVKPPDGPSQIVGSGAAGALRGWEQVLEISVGRIKRRMPVKVVEGSQMLLLGQPFFQGIHYQIDNASNYLIFTRDSRDISKQMTYDSIEVPFKMVHGNCMVSARVNGVPTQMNFDTGAPKCLFTNMAMNQLGLKVVATTEIPGAGGLVVPGYYCLADIVELGPIRKQGLEVLVSPSCTQNVLGQDFFGRMKFIVDNEKQVIRFQR